MNKRYKKHGKAIRWIDSRFSRPFKARKSIVNAMAAQVAMQSALRIRIINQARFATAGIGKAEKAVAIARALIDGQVAILKTYNHFSEIMGTRVKIL